MAAISAHEHEHITQFYSKTWPILKLQFQPMTTKVTVSRASEILQFQHFVFYIFNKQIYTTQLRFIGLASISFFFLSFQTSLKST